MISDEVFQQSFGDVRSHLQRARAEVHSAASWLVFWQQTLALLRPLADHPRFVDEVAPYVSQQLDASCGQRPRELSTSWLAEAFGAGWEVAPWGALGSVCDVLWVEGEPTPDDPMRRVALMRMGQNPALACFPRVVPRHLLMDPLLVQEFADEARLHPRAHAELFGALDALDATVGHIWEALHEAIDEVPHEPEHDPALLTPSMTSVWRRPEHAAGVMCQLAAPLAHAVHLFVWLMPVEVSLEDERQSLEHTAWPLHHIERIAGEVGEVVGLTGIRAAGSLPDDDGHTITMLAFTQGGYTLRVLLSRGFADDSDGELRALREALFEAVEALTGDTLLGEDL